MKLNEAAEAIDCKYTDNCICPYCGVEDEDSWEIKSNQTEGYCHSCDKKFAMEQEHTRTFCTSKTCQTNDDCQFDAWRDYIKGESIYRRCTICGRYEYKKEPLQPPQEKAESSQAEGLKP